MSLPIRVTLASALVLMFAWIPGTSIAASGSATCSRYASTTGRDTGAGSVQDPYRTVQWLMDHLAASETGCLRGGTYVEPVTIGRGGTPGSPITLKSAPGETAVLRGRLWVKDSANDVAISDLVLDGRNTSSLPSPSVNGDRISFVRDDVSNGNTAICFDIGSVLGYGIAAGVVLDSNRIHNCGILPAQNHHHGVFLENAVGGVVRNNLIYNNADKGILLYPSSVGVLIENNVIDGNGTGIMIGGSLLQDPWHPRYPRNNVIRRNLITNSRRYNVEAYWEWAPPGDSNNVVTDNCVWGSGMGVQIQSPEQASQWGRGFDAYANIEADPGYQNRAAVDFTLPAGSACSGRGPTAVGQAGTSLPQPASTTPTLPASSPSSNTTAPPAVPGCSQRGWAGPLRWVRPHPHQPRRRCHRARLPDWHR